jgi:hypothetical protein
VAVPLRFLWLFGVCCDTEQNMNDAVVPSPFVSLSAVIRGLRVAVAAWGGRGLLAEALVLLVYRRLGEIVLRMERMAARFQAGRLWRRGPRVVVEGDAAVVRLKRVRGTRVWPSEFGWLVRIASYQAAGFGSQLRAVLEQPEMVALLKAAPQAVRVLRPLCRMLAIETALLRPGVEVPVRVVVKRVRKPRVPIDFGRVPLPRGVLSAARRQGFGKIR